VSIHSKGKRIQANQLPLFDLSFHEHPYLQQHSLATPSVHYFELSAPAAALATRVNWVLFTAGFS
jgi:hypothetical protein